MNASAPIAAGHRHSVTAEEPEPQRNPRPLERIDDPVPAHPGPEQEQCHRERRKREHRDELCLHGQADEEPGQPGVPWEDDERPDEQRGEHAS